MFIKTKPLFIERHFTKKFKKILRHIKIKREKQVVLLLSYLNIYQTFKKQNKKFEFIRPNETYKIKTREQDVNFLI